MQTLRRRRQIPQGKRTEARDAAASWIEENVIEEDRWPLTYTEMAEESGWSRQHIANTIEYYFAEADTESQEVMQDEFASRFEAYRAGFNDGWEEGYKRGVDSN